MDTWSSIRDKAELFYRTWKPEIQIYGIGLMLTICGILTRRDKAALLVFSLTLLYDLMRRFGEPYRQLGAEEFKRRQLERQLWWKQQTEDLLQRLIGRHEPPNSPVKAHPPQPLIRLNSQAEEPPESPSSPLPESRHASSQLPPPVTHET